jgi:Domain of Unknown Function (DUF930)
MRLSLTLYCDDCLTGKHETDAAPSFGRASFACRFSIVEAHGLSGRWRETGTLFRAVFALALVAPVTTVASAIDAKVERMLKQLDPDARFEQICDLEAMQRIGKDKTYRPERTIVSALADPKVADATMTGAGGAFKSKGQWYQFSFTCKTSPDHMQVLSFSYQIGEPIPQEQWEKNGLW